MNRDKRDVERMVRRVLNRVETDGSGHYPLRLTDRQRENIAEFCGCDPEELEPDDDFDPVDVEYKNDPARIVPFNAAEKSAAIGDGLSVRRHD
jgi:hypothetical protein